MSRPAAESRSRATDAPVTLNCLSVDVEEYYHAEVFHGSVSPADWPRMQRRAEPLLERIVELLETHDSRATFFVLGAMVEHLGPKLRRLAEGGHEIACHGNDHRHLARLDPQELGEDLRTARKRIEDVTGVRTLGYRAPTFSVTRGTAWALDVIIAEGFEYDASIFPIRHDRYGVSTAPVEPFWAVAPSGARILEFPPLTLDWRVLRVPIGGGGYLRLFPDAVVRRCIAARERREQPALVYVHPWELDPHQPRLAIGWASQWRHRVNLHKTEAKLERLLSTHRFDTADRILRHVRTTRELPTFALSDQVRKRGGYTSSPTVSRVSTTSKHP